MSYESSRLVIREKHISKEEFEFITMIKDLYVPGKSYKLTNPNHYPKILGKRAILLSMEVTHNLEDGDVYVVNFITK